MVKVINHGKFYRIAKCKKCGCSFGYSVSDLKERIGKNEDGSDAYCVHCPECEEIYIDNENLVDKRYPKDKEEN